MNQRKSASSLSEWTRRYVTKPAQRALHELPEFYSIECDDCEGSGRDWVLEDICPKCDGDGQVKIYFTDKQRRQMFDRALIEVGLNPRSFDDFGRLIPA